MSSSFRNGLLAGFALILLGTAWLSLRWQDIALSLTEMYPSKTTPIERAKNVKIPEETSVLEKSTKTAEKKSEALVQAPLEGLYEKTEQGLQIPLVRIQDGLSPFNAYKKPFSNKADKPTVSIVVVDFGLSESISQSMLDNLPGEISFVLSPYSVNKDKWAKSARANGHEFWLALPLQGDQFGKSQDSGPLTILLNASMEENRNRLFTLMGSVTGYAGLIAEKNHSFTTKDAASTPVLEQIYGRGLAFVDSNPHSAAFGGAMAMETGSPYTQGSLWLDETLSPSDIENALKSLETQALRQGEAVAFTRPYPIVIKIMQDWLVQAPEKGLQIAPLSVLADPAS